MFSLTQIIFALVIIGQPAGQINFVPDRLGFVSQYSFVQNYGVDAYLAHDFLSGSDFYHIQPGDLILADGRAYTFDQTIILQNVTPDDGFQATYPHLAGHLVLQTCYLGGYYFATGDPAPEFDDPTFAGVLLVIRRSNDR